MPFFVHSFLFFVPNGFIFNFPADEVDIRPESGLFFSGLIFRTFADGCGPADDDVGKMLVFQLMHARGQRIGRVVGHDGTLGLEEGLAGIQFAIDQMDGYTRLLVAAAQHVLVYVVAVHAFAAMFGQQGGVDVDNAAGIGVNQIFGHAHQESRQHNAVYFMAAEQAEYFVLLLPLGTAHTAGGHTEFLGTRNGTDARLAGHKQYDFNVRVAAQVVQNVFGVGAFTRSKDSKIDHDSFLFCVTTKVQKNCYNRTAQLLLFHIRTSSSYFFVLI